MIEPVVNNHCAGEAPAPAGGRVLSSSHPVAGLPWLRPIKDLKELARVLEKLEGDNDAIVRPTHLVERGGAIIGAAAIGSTLLLDLWAHTEHMRARDSVAMLNLIENLAAAKGAEAICLPCTARSPFRSFMEKFGFTFAGESGMFYKQLKG